MSDAQFVKVKYRLTDQVAREGGMTAGLASERAARELAAHAGDAKKSLGATIGRLEAMCREQTATADAVYEEGAAVLDIAGMFNFRTLCDGAYSLCELTDRLRSRGMMDWKAVTVHASALRLIWASDKDGTPELKTVVDGLWAITDRFQP